MASPVYTEPAYVLSSPTTTLLSDARPLQLTSAALLAVNYLLDELLHLTINASLGGVGAGSSATGAPVTLGPLAESEVLTTERFKAGVIRVVGPLLGKNAVLEAEVAVRELLRHASSGMRGDAALKKSSLAASSAKGQSSAVATSVQADDIFRSLRAFVQIISGLGATPSPTSPHVTFITALYAERCMTYIAEHVVRAVGRVAERESRVEAAGLKELEAALGEDQSVWTWLQGMRVRAYIESEIAAASARGNPAAVQPAVRRTAVSGSGKSRASIDSAGSSTKITYGKKDKDAGPGISEPAEDDFEALMLSGKTMKVTLTPDRLRTKEVSTFYGTSDT
ncbi:hypothetical protein RQP46_005948 [Phenoliferia psychrophenolica]